MNNIHADILRTDHMLREVFSEAPKISCWCVPTIRDKLFHTLQIKGRVKKIKSNKMNDTCQRISQI